MGDIVNGDALACLGAIGDDVADIVFLDPPFNLGKKYGNQTPKADRVSENEYLAYMTEILAEAIRILKPGGALYLYHVPKRAIQFAPFLSENLTFRHWIAVSMKNGFPKGKGLYPAHYALLYYTKGTPAIANRPKIVPLTCPHCDLHIRDYGGYKAHVKHGVNLSDVWDDLSPVRHAKYKNRAANELPLVLPRRITEISGAPGGLLVDPFAGTGTAIIAAKLKKMKFIAVDRERENCDLILERLNNTKRGKPSIRR